MLLLSESFDLDSTLLDLVDFNGGGNITVVSAAARNGLFGMRANGNNSFSYGKSLGTNATTLIAGVAHRGTNFPSTNGWMLMGFGDNASWNGTSMNIQVGITVQSNGLISASRQNNIEQFTATLGTSVLAVPNYPNVWHYYQIKATFAGSNAGTVEILVDGVTYLSLTGVTTIQSANAYANTICVSIGTFGGGQVGVDDFDDLYVCDATGNQCNNYLGDVTIVGQVPVANGTANNFQRGGSVVNAQNWQQVNDIPPDGDTTYVFDSNVGDEEGYTYGALTQTSANVYGINFKPRIRKDDSGTRSVQLAHLSQGVEVYSGVNYPLSMTYTYPNLIQQLDPATGQPWTIAGVNGCEQRVRITA